MAGGSSTWRYRGCPRCPRSWRRSPVPAWCCSTVACGGVPTCSPRWRWARMRYCWAGQGASPAQVRRMFLQYGRTNGHIHGLIAQLLATDENVHVTPAAIAVTAGAQEAMVVALRGLCAGPGDVLLTPDPCYVGIVGAAALLDVEVVPVPETGSGIEPAEVARVARAVRAQGK